MVHMSQSEGTMNERSSLSVSYYEVRGGETAARLDPKSVERVRLCRKDKESAPELQGRLITQGRENVAVDSRLLYGAWWVKNARARWRPALKFSRRPWLT